MEPLNGNLTDLLNFHKYFHNTAMFLTAFNSRNNQINTQFVFSVSRVTERRIVDKFDFCLRIDIGTHGWTTSCQKFQHEAETNQKLYE